MERQLKAAQDRLVVLLVDDEPEILSALRRCLRQEPYELITAGGAAEALDWLGKTSVDLIITDERMPAKTGTQLLRETRDRSPWTLRALFSGYPSEALVGNGLEAGTDVFIYKPWDERFLRETVRGILQRKASNASKWDAFDASTDLPFDLGGEGG